MKLPFHDNIDSGTINIKQELIKIIKNYDAPASARVQAIREYNSMIESIPQEDTEEPLLKLLTSLEAKDQQNNISKDKPRDILFD